MKGLRKDKRVSHGIISERSKQDLECYVREGKEDIKTIRSRHPPVDFQLEAEYELESSTSMEMGGWLCSITICTYQVV